MTRHGLIVFASVLFLLTLSTFGAQQSPPAPANPGQNPDRFEDAHKGLFTPQSTPGQDAARTTNEVAKGLPDAGQSLARVPRKNFIDEAIFSRIERDKIPHAALSSDEEFVRRVYVDATGILPTAQQVKDFVANRDVNKRDKLIDSLIGTEEFTEQFAWFWGDLLRLGADTGFGKNATQYWLKEWLLLDRPYNEVVFDMLTPTSKAHNTIPSLGLIGRVNLGICFVPQDADDFRVTNRL